MSLMELTKNVSPGLLAGPKATKELAQAALIPVAGRRAILWILLAGGILRLGLWLMSWQLPIHIVDEQHYNALAINLVQHREFAFVPGELTSLRPPLYPALVAGVYWLCGVETFQLVRLLQAILSLGTVIIVYKLGTIIASQRMAILAAGFCCFYPSLLGYNNLLLTEVLFTFLLCAFCLLVVQGLQRQSLMLMAAAGVTLGLATLTRSVLWLFPPVLGIFLLWAWPGRIGMRLVAASVLALSFAGTIMPWTVRNTLLQQTFVTIDVMGGRNFMMGNYQYTPLYRSWDAISQSGDKSWVHEVFATYTPSELSTQGKVDKMALRQGLKFVRENPGLTLLRDIIKFFDFWGQERELVAGAAQGFFGPLPKMAIACLSIAVCGSYTFALFFGIFGLVMRPLPDRKAHWFMLLVVAFICGMHTLVFGHSRYHLPLMPLILLFAANAWVNRRELWQQRNTLQFLLACGLCVAFLLGWLWLFIAVDYSLFLNVMG